MHLSVMKIAKKRTRAMMMRIKFRLSFRESEKRFIKIPLPYL